MRYVRIDQQRKSADRRKRRDGPRTRWLRRRVIDTVTPEVPGVPLRKIISRYLVLAVGSAPILGALFIYYALFSFFFKGSDCWQR